MKTPEVKICFRRPDSLLKEWAMLGELHSSHVEITVPVMQLPFDIRENIVKNIIENNNELKIYGIEITKYNFQKPFTTFVENKHLPYYGDYYLAKLYNTKKMFPLEWHEKEANYDKMLQKFIDCYKYAKEWENYFIKVPLWLQWYNYWKNEENTRNITLFIK